MLPVDFPGSNINFTKPDSMTDEQCGTLRGFAGIRKDAKILQVAYRPSKEDMTMLRNNGQIVMIMSIPATAGRMVRFSMLPDPGYGFTYVGHIAAYQPLKSEVRLLDRGFNLWITFLGDTFPVISVSVIEPKTILHG